MEFALIGPIVQTWLDVWQYPRRRCSIVVSVVYVFNLNSFYRLNTWQRDVLLLKNSFKAYDKNVILQARNAMLDVGRIYLPQCCRIKGDTNLIEENLRFFRLSSNAIQTMC